MAPPAPQPVAVTGMGVVSPIGVGVAAFAESLQNGRPGLHVAEGLGSEPPSLVGRVTGFDPRSRIPVRTLRRLPWLVQMALFAAHEAVEDAGLPPALAERTGVVVGTGLGSLETTVHFLREIFTVGPAQANPALFPASVMNAAAAYISMELGLKGYSTTVNHKDASALGAVALAVDVLRAGRADAVLCGAVDEVSPAAVHGYRRFGALSRGGTARPFDRRRDGLALGEGAAFFVLELEDAARRRKAGIRALVRGAGLASTRAGLLAWDRDPEAAARAIRNALLEAGCGPDDIDYVASGANGSRQLDRVEAGTLTAIFGPRPVPVSSILGQTGDSHSAAGLRLASAILAVERDIVPGTSGFETPDPEAPVGGLVVNPRKAHVAQALVASHATGGAEAALVLGRAASGGPAEGAAGGIA